MSRAELGPVGVYHRVVVYLLFADSVAAAGRDVDLLDLQQLVGDHSAQRLYLQVVHPAVERSALSAVPSGSRCWSASAR